jgi:hypothetical protein
VEGLEWLDTRLVAITVTHFPDSRTLAADEADEEPTAAGWGTAVDTSGYDPAYLLPFCCQVIPSTREGCVCHPSRSCRFFFVLLLA